MMIVMSRSGRTLIDRSWRALPTSAVCETSNEEVLARARAPLRREISGRADLGRYTREVAWASSAWAMTAGSAHTYAAEPP
jgi:hypothetical protein